MSLNVFCGSHNKKHIFELTIGNHLMDYIFKCNPPTSVNCCQKTMMQVKATPTLCGVQIGCHWVGVFVLIFRMTLIIQRKVKGKGMMNFKCRQEDQRSKDILVSFPGSKLSLSSLDTLWLAVTGPVCLYQHLTTIFLPRMHTHIHTYLQWWVCSSA